MVVYSDSARSCRACTSTIYRAATTGDWPRAAELQKRAIAALQMIHVGNSGGSRSANAIGAIKVALREIGVIRTANLAIPFQPLNSDEEEAVRAILRALDIAAPVPV